MDRPETARDSTDGRKPYTAPLLTAYGPLVRLTRASSGNCSDNNQSVFNHRTTPTHPRCVDANGNTYTFPNSP